MFLEVKPCFCIRFVDLAPLLDFLQSLQWGLGAAVCVWHQLCRHSCSGLLWNTLFQWFQLLSAIIASNDSAWGRGVTLMGYSLSQGSVGLFGGRKEALPFPPGSPGQHPSPCSAWEGRLHCWTSLVANWTEKLCLWKVMKTWIETVTAMLILCSCVGALWAGWGALLYFGEEKAVNLALGYHCCSGVGVAEWRMRNEMQGWRSLLVRAPVLRLCERYAAPGRTAVDVSADLDQRQVPSGTWWKHGLREPHTSSCLPVQQIKCSCVCYLQRMGSPMDGCPCKQLLNAHWELIMALEGSRDGETLRQLLWGCMFFHRWLLCLLPGPSGLSATFLGVALSMVFQPRIRNFIFLHPRMIFSSLQLELWCHNADTHRIFHPVHGFLQHYLCPESFPLMLYLCSWSLFFAVSKCSSLHCFPCFSFYWFVGAFGTFLHFINSDHDLQSASSS